MWYLLLKAKTARIFLVRRTGRVKSSSHPQWTASDGICTRHASVAAMAAMSLHAANFSPKAAVRVRTDNNQ